MKTKILQNIFLSLGVIFGLAITVHAQNLFVSITGDNSFIYSATIQIFDANGNLITTLCGRATATRFSEQLHSRLGCASLEMTSSYFKSPNNVGCVS
jgi:hypothetical protein